MRGGRCGSWVVDPLVEVQRCGGGGGGGGVQCAAHPLHCPFIRAMLIWGRVLSLEVACKYSEALALLQATYPFLRDATHGPTGGRGAAAGGVLDVPMNGLAWNERGFVHGAVAHIEAKRGRYAEVSGFPRRGRRRVLCSNARGAADVHGLVVCGVCVVLAPCLTPLLGATSHHSAEV